MRAKIVHAPYTGITKKNTMLPTKTNRFCVLFFLLCIMKVYGQEDSPVSYGSFFGLSASRYEPAVLGRDFKHVDVTLINAYVWAGNTTFSRQEIVNLANAEVPDINEVVARLKNRNRIGFGTTIDYLNVGLRINSHEEVKKHGTANKVWCPGDFFMEEKFSLSFGIAERVEANIRYSGDIFRLAWQGNKQFENDNADLSIIANAFYAREWTLGAAMPIHFHYNHGIWKHMEYRAGIRVKYIQGLAAAYTKNSDISLFTAKDGKYLDLNYDYDYRYAYNINDPLDFNPLRGVGRGVGTDLSLNFHYKTRVYANINLLDLGFVRFNKQAGRVADNNTIHFDGIDMGSLLGDSLSVETSEYTSVYEDFEIQEGRPFTMPYPTRLRLHMAYRVPGTNRQEELYHKHTFGITYIQGFKDFGNATIVPYFAAAYVFNLFDHFEIGTNIGGSGYNRTEWGLFAAFRVGFFRMGVGSGNLTALFKNYGTGGDINANISLSW